jgi:hypothetical protein
MKEISASLYKELQEIGLKFNSQLAFQDYRLIGTNVCYSPNYDRGIFHDYETRFVEAIYIREGFDTEIIYVGEFKSVQELKDKLIELGYLK